MKLVSLLLPVALLLALPAEANPSSDDIAIYAASLVGSPYRLGGTSVETGVDCSGFVGHVFKQTTGILLPRDSQGISQAAEPLAQDELRAGDLVFFNTLNRVFSHVGIYLGDGRFVHAASSRSGAVMVSNLTDRYWRERFDGGRRIAPPAPVQPVDAWAD